MSGGRFIRAPHHDLDHTRPQQWPALLTPEAPTPPDHAVHDFYRAVCAMQLEPFGRTNRDRKRQRTSSSGTQPGVTHLEPSQPPAAETASSSAPAPPSGGGCCSVDRQAASPGFCRVCQEAVATTMEEHLAGIAHLFRAQEKPQPLVSYSMGSSNPGWRLLEQQGWTPHTGLGKSGTGILAPLATRFRSNRQGLGNAPLSAKRRTHTSEHIAAVKCKEDALRREQPCARAMTRVEQAQAHQRDRIKDRVLRELLHTDNWEHLHPGQPLPLSIPLSAWAET
eukprot:GGOE01061461.1.p1 GENE.GGOE01061461.1~~GGOE01061461.1.p1  ORF type:complete len:291 (+),score=31.26 GGOE01061461.1:34-873(+)